MGKWRLRYHRTVLNRAGDFIDRPTLGLGTEVESYLCTDLSFFEYILNSCDDDKNLRLEGVLMLGEESIQYVMWNASFQWCPVSQVKSLKV